MPIWESQLYKKVFVYPPNELVLESIQNQSMNIPRPIVPGTGYNVSYSRGIEWDRPGTYLEVLII